jgi:hypothetical protein
MMFWKLSVFSPKDPCVKSEYRNPKFETMSNTDESKRATIETITPLSAAAFKRNEGATAVRRRRQWMTILVLLGSLALLVIGGGWLLYYLSRNPLQTKDITKIAPPPPAQVKQKAVQRQPEQPTAAVAPEKLSAQKEAAEQKLADYLAVKNKLDNLGAVDWGEASYAEMIQLGEAADAAFMNKEYETAAEQYGRATLTANELVGRRSEILARLLDEGLAALDAGDGVLAQQKFSAALAVDPTNPVARRGQARAKTIDAVTALIASGRQHEADGKLALASDDYRQAVELDAYSQAARRALENVNGRIRDDRFKQLVSEGLAAFHRQEYPLARNKLIQARRLKPDSREVADALAQVDQAAHLARMAELQNKALVAEQAEDWQVAFESYQAVLAIDPSVQFARQGKSRAAEQIRIAKRLDFFLNKPETLESDNQLKNASLLIAEAGEIESQGPQLKARIKKLERLVAIAKTPVKITLESDNLTQVAVYRVGKLGRFEVHELELRPGTYTVVGSREGFQDVRQKIVVKPGPQPIRITIKCKVKI